MNFSSTSNKLEGLSQGFAPMIFLIPIKEREKKILITQFETIHKKYKPLKYMMTEHDIARAMGYLDQGMDIYLAATIEYIYWNKDGIKLNVFKLWNKLSGVVAESDNVQRLADYLNMDIREL